MPSGEERYLRGEAKESGAGIDKARALANEGQETRSVCSREKAYLHLIGERSDGLRAERIPGVSYAR